VQVHTRIPVPNLQLAVSYANPATLGKWNASQWAGTQDSEERTFVFDPQFLNRYTYAHNNPLAYVDDSGNIIWWVVGAIAGGLIGGGAYVATHWGHLTWQGALAWTVGGVIIGATLGFATPYAVAYFGPAISVWAMNALQRGIQIENMLAAKIPGQHLVSNNPVIDIWNKATGVVTSIKSIDLAAQTYQNMYRLAYTIYGYLNELALYTGQEWAGVTIKSGQITSKVLQLAIPQGASPEQISTLYKMIEVAYKMGITLKFETIK
jgi:hypothetical protein